MALAGQIVCTVFYNYFNIQLADTLKVSTRGMLDVTRTTLVWLMCIFL